MPTFTATWTGVPQITVTGDDVFDVLARAQGEYEDGSSDPDDDPDHVSPLFQWVLVWHEGQRRRLVLVADGVRTDMHVDEVTGPPTVELVPVTEFVQAIDFDGESVWQDPETGMVVWTPPGYDGKATRVLEPLFRRVTEPAGSVTT